LIKSFYQTCGQDRTIAADNLGSYNGPTFQEPFYGNLRARYLSGGTGTYTTTSPASSSSVWTKQ